ncbi:ALK and LTK ligand 2b [Phycodurus eques]|uniref:ALK and LTK ligand 2b n=1 Tax=Phycodurus eques TaxID=693459 RepID=UPI002ACEE138|nr:ALK and LTK ligand 2b [Phycodurus eques]
MTMARWLTVKSVLLLVAGCYAVAALLKSCEPPHNLKLVSHRSDETTEQGELHTKSGFSVQLAAQSTDLRYKDKIIKHLTGPLYVSPKCRSHFHRLYHNRDCVIPAYLKRCAHLLTRLANSLRCAER